MPGGVETRDCARDASARPVAAPRYRRRPSRCPDRRAVEVGKRASFGVLKGSLPLAQGEGRSQISVEVDRGESRNRLNGPSRPLGQIAPVSLLPRPPASLWSNEPVKLSFYCFFLFQSNMVADIFSFLPFPLCSFSRIFWGAHATRIYSEHSPERTFQACFQHRDLLGFAQRPALQQ